MKLQRNVTAKVIEIGNFNILVKSWYDTDGNSLSEEMKLEVDDVVNIKEYDAPTVPGGIHTLITKSIGGGQTVSTTVLGKLVFDRSDAKYNMKEDRHRILVSTL